jgi:sugar (pentulose or hexulose) kinase
VNDNNDTRLIAVFDIGKTNVKLNVVTAQGEVLETLSTPNPSHDGPPYRHHDLNALEEWLLTNLGTFASRHPLGTVVACGHGSGCVLVDDDGPASPMIDYEQPLPPAIERAYADAAGPYLERGSPIMLGATHIARQMLWLELEYPEAFARARHVLGLPQYWAWRLSGVAASEVTILGAQSHIWNVPGRCPSSIVTTRGWQRLIPPFAPAWKALGPIRPDLARRHDLPPTLRILCGIHDSSANFYRYQAAGLADMTVVSTGTWIVGLSDSFDPAALSEARGMTCNADVHGRPLAGALTMGGREFSKVAGPSPDTTPTDATLIARLIERGTMALPSFGNEDGLFPGSRAKGRITGPAPETPAERRALAVLYTALLTSVCLDALRSEKLVILDGSFVRDPLYAALVAACRPDRPTLFNLNSQGTAAGSALLANHETRTAPVPIPLEKPPPLNLPGLTAYRTRWLDLAQQTKTSELETRE